MASNEVKQEVLQWIDDGCNYQIGVALYTQYGKNPFLKRDFPAHQNRYSTKIIYELCKSVGLDYQQLKSEKRIKVEKTETIPSIRLEGKPTSTASPSTALRSGKGSVGESLFKATVGELVEPPETIETTHIEEYPAIIRRVITEYAETFQERSKTHRIMTEMPEGNSQALKTKREQLFGIVKSLSDRLQLLYDTQEVYKSTGFVPDESEIWPAPKEKATTELPDDAEQLRKMKKNQQSSNTKDQNLLDYQSEKRGETKRAMPNGPKRMKLENRIKARIRLIDEIDFKLLKL